ncbi:hypothetical protein GPECTOR_3g302 [Gonium pectorale]|uniref:EF-hand domain-containing protein n=1 Tax=Gonium pectorale TaxID=33097 RepID=A0A150GZF0_GONPE|nr:hypothetical protein GPECTOR_3g302 [Gonium pectorale]|eukprot:KXZ55154.1 hypothetical protein GPECTOR_3g302 [Gonium pectorale]
MQANFTPQEQEQIDKLKANSKAAAAHVDASVCSHCHGTGTIVEIYNHRRLENYCQHCNGRGVHVYKNGVEVKETSAASATATSATARGPSGVVALHSRNAADDGGDPVAASERAAALEQDLKKIAAKAAAYTRERLQVLAVMQQPASSSSDAEGRDQAARDLVAKLDIQLERLELVRRKKQAELTKLRGGRGPEAKVSRSVQTSHVKSWLHSHGYVVKADKLHPAVTRVIAEWFRLVDEDNSRTLEAHELLAALKAAQIPCDDATISEMIAMMDMNRDGVIGWDEFEVFMTEEFAAGKSLLSGEYLLPSGLSINFGVMIGKLKRDRLLGDVMKDSKRRSKWADIARDPAALGRELATMQEAAEAANLTQAKKLSEEVEAGKVTPRRQLTTAILRAMEHNRKLQRMKSKATTTRDALPDPNEEEDGAQPLASPMPLNDGTADPIAALGYDLSSTRGVLLPSSRADSLGPSAQLGSAAPPPAGLAMRPPERGSGQGSAVAGSAAFAAASYIKAQEPPAALQAEDASPAAAPDGAQGAASRLFGNVGGRTSPVAGRHVKAPGEPSLQAPGSHAMAPTASSLLHRRRVARTMSCVAELAEGLRASSNGQGGGRGPGPRSGEAPQPSPPPLEKEGSLPALDPRRSSAGSASGSPAASPRSSAMPLQQHYLRAPGHPQHLQMRRPSRVSINSEPSGSSLGSPSSSVPAPLPNVHVPPSAAARAASGGSAATAAAAGGGSSGGVPTAPTAPPLAPAAHSAPLPPLAYAPMLAAAAWGQGTPRVYSQRMLPILPDHGQLSAFMDSTIAVARADWSARPPSPGARTKSRTDLGLTGATHGAPLPASPKASAGPHMASLGSAAELGATAAVIALAQAQGRRRSGGPGPAAARASGPSANGDFPPGASGLGGHLDMHDADDEVARLLDGDGGWSAWLERNRPDPQNGRENMLRGPRGEPLEDLEEKWARAPLPETLLRELGSQAGQRITAEGTGSGGVQQWPSAPATVLTRWHGPYSSVPGPKATHSVPNADDYEERERGFQPNWLACRGCEPAATAPR